MAERPYSRRYRKVRARGELTAGAPLYGPMGEIHRNLPKPGEGFSIRTTGPGVGKPARNSLAVAFAPEEGRGAEVPMDSTKSIAWQMREFNDTRIATLGAKGASMAQGGWVDPETGIVQQDASVLLPRTKEGMRAAMHIGVQGGQEAIGNLGHKGYLGDINIPHYLQKDQYQGPLGHEPRVEHLGVSETGRQRVRITPGLQESIEVESDILSAKHKFKDKVKEKGAGQYVKESLAFIRKNRKPLR